MGPVRDGNFRFYHHLAFPSVRFRCSNSPCRTKYVTKSDLEKLGTVCLDRIPRGHQCPSVVRTSFPSPLPRILSTAHHQPQWTRAARTSEMQRYGHGMEGSLRRMVSLRARRVVLLDMLITVHQIRALKIFLS